MFIVFIFFTVICETEDKLNNFDFRKQEKSEVAAQIPEQDPGMVSRELIFRQTE